MKNFLSIFAKKNVQLIPSQKPGKRRGTSGETNRRSKAKNSALFEQVLIVRVTNGRVDFGTEGENYQRKSPLQKSHRLQVKGTVFVVEFP